MKLPTPQPMPETPALDAQQHPAASPPKQLHRPSAQQAAGDAIGGWQTGQGKGFDLSAAAQARAAALIDVCDEQPAKPAAASPAAAAALPVLQTAGGKALAVSDEARRRAAAFFEDEPAAVPPAPQAAETPLAATSMQQRSNKSVASSADAQLCAVKRNSGVASPALRPNAKSGGASPFTPLRLLQARTNLAAASATPGRTAPRTASGVKPVLGRRGSPQKTPLTARRAAVSALRLWLSVSSFSYQRTSFRPIRGQQLICSYAMYQLSRNCDSSKAVHLQARAATTPSTLSSEGANWVCTCVAPRQDLCQVKVTLTMFSEASPSRMICRAKEDCARAALLYIRRGAGQQRCAGAMATAEPAAAQP